MVKISELVSNEFDVALNEYRLYVSLYVNTNKTNKTIFRDGTIYPLTIETLHYLKRLYEYRNTVDGMKVPSSSSSSSSSFTSSSSSTLSPTSSPALLLAAEYEKKITPLTSITLLILSGLEQNLENKAKTYKNHPLSCIFLINNYHYISKHVGPRSSLPMGKNFVDKYDSLVKKLRDDYKLSSWDKAISYLDLSDSKEILSKCHPVVTKQAKKLIKSKFSGFNSQFQELYNTQRLYSLPDSDLRSQLRNDNVDYVLKLYKNFLNTYQSVQFSSHSGTYIKYDVTTLEVMLNKFFDEES